MLGRESNAFSVYCPEVTRVIEFTKLEANRTVKVRRTGPVGVATFDSYALGHPVRDSTVCRVLSDALYVLHGFKFTCGGRRGSARGAAVRCTCDRNRVDERVAIGKGYSTRAERVDQSDVPSIAKQAFVNERKRQRGTAKSRHRGKRSERQRKGTAVGALAPSTAGGSCKRAAVRAAVRGQLYEGSCTRAAHPQYSRPFSVTTCGGSRRRAYSCNPRR